MCATRVNLQAFSATVEKGADFETCIENIDIGGPSMIRSAAKNNASVTVVTAPSQYAGVIAELEANNGGTSRALRRKYAAAAFAHTAAYDSAIARWFEEQVGSECTTITRTYVKSIPLKYGCNPHQSPAFIGRLVSTPELPFKVLNGTPGYINFLDAANAWQLAFELKEATGLAAAASFKHVSPAGAAVAVALDDTLAQVYDVDAAKMATLTPVALAYLRARNADPMCSFGDFAAVSDVVDEATALLLKPEVRYTTFKLARQAMPRCACVCALSFLLASLFDHMHCRYLMVSLLLDTRLRPWRYCEPRRAAHSSS